MEHLPTDAERNLEHDSDELEHRIHNLEEHIEEAEQELKARRRDADMPLENAAGDWEDESEGAQRGG
jgi:multidrug resistance efflux pump